MHTRITTPRGALEIRSAVEDDADGFRELRLRALRLHPVAFSADYAINAGQPMEYWRDRLRAADRANGGTIVVAVQQDGKLAAMSGIREGSSSKLQHASTIWGVYVDDDWRGFGVAEKLLDACLDWARTRGLHSVKLAVLASNAPAIRAYTRAGFKVYGLEVDAIRYQEVFYDELLMVKFLKARVS